MLKTCIRFTLKRQVRHAGTDLSRHQGPEGRSSTRPVETEMTVSVLKWHARYCCLPEQSGNGPFLIHRKSI